MENMLVTITIQSKFYPAYQDLNLRNNKDFIFWYQTFKRHLLSHLPSPKSILYCNEINESHGNRDAIEAVRKSLLQNGVSITLHRFGTHQLRRDEHLNILKRLLQLLSQHPINHVYSFSTTRSFRPDIWVTSPIYPSYLFYFIFSGYFAMFIFFFCNFVNSLKVGRIFIFQCCRPVGGATNLHKSVNAASR
jgi:hypothetical protein